MSKDNVVEIKKQERDIEDPITAILRQGAKRLLTEAIEAEVEEFLSRYQDLRDEQGRQRIVRNGYLPEREVQTGIGQVQVKVPRTRDRHTGEGEGVDFIPSILPRYLRRTKSIEELIPWLYLKGVSTGDFTEALAALLGKDAPGLSPSTISRLKDSWQGEMDEWRKRDLSKKRYVYFWVDGLYSNVRMEERQCLLVIIGATENGQKELIALEDGYRESEQSWKGVLLDLKKRGLTHGPKLAIGDGSLGFWKALYKVYGKTRWQRCWVHKTANVLDKLPKSIQKKAKEKLHEIWMAPSKKEAEKSFDTFVSTYEAKYPKAAACLQKDKDVLLTFYDFPAEHWRHIRTTNPIESTFATVALRTAKVRNCFSSKTVATMAFQMCKCAQKRWKRLNRPEQMAKIIEDVKFENGIEIERKAA